MEATADAKEWAMSSMQLALYIVAAIVLILGAILDDPRFNVTRCIALALGLVILAQIIH